MEQELLTAEDVAKLLRIKKYTVYELIKRGELPSSKVGKQVRVSRTDISRYLEAGKTGSAFPRPAPPADSAAENPPASSAVIISGQDMCLDLIVNKIAEAGVPVLRSYSGCYNSLYALYNGKVTMASSHLWDAQTDTYNYPFIQHLLPGLRVGILRLAGRMQGLYVKKGNPLGIRDWKDLVRPDVTLINREKGCGTRILLDQKLKLLGITASDIKGYTRESSSHMVCASTVAKGGAGAGCGCERGAETLPGVDFIPLQLEWYDLVFRLADKYTPALQTILSYVSSADFRQDLEMMRGYDVSQTGRYEEF
ncbi:MAG: helix-turn-helix transcriptional regulator [Spirochaetales bacterium]|jgi:putative molybdopterin biosynthesis protein|nr:helix-turn-helix transcriptional regulator [Spirochaetales bacterium]